MNLPTTLPALGAMPAFMQTAATQSSMGTFGDSFGGRRVQLKGGQINFLTADKKPMGVVQDEYGVVQFPQYTSSANIIIVGVAPENNTVYRAFYLEKYKDGDTSPPSCWSVDGAAPNPKSSAPQSTTCANCPKNVLGTSDTGKGKACHSRKKLAVVFANDPAMRVFSMDLSGSALFGKSAREGEGYFTLFEYARHLKQFNAAWEGVITEVSFAEGSNIGVRFRALTYATQEQFAAVWALRTHTDVTDALTIDFAQRKAEHEQQVAAPAYQAVDTKAALLAHPAFQTTLAHLRDWAQHPAITTDMIRVEAAKYSVTL